MNQAYSTFSGTHTEHKIAETATQ